MKRSTGQGLPKKEHWEKHYDMHEPSRNMYLTGGSDFAAKNPTNRKTTYVKVNETDH